MKAANSAIAHVMMNIGIIFSYLNEESSNRHGLWNMTIEVAGAGGLLWPTLLMAVKVVRQLL